MNSLEKYFCENTDRVIFKWQHYFEVYERHLSRYRGTDVHLLEVGVANGGSLQMWKSYFGPRAKIYGVDINPLCKELEQEDQIQIFIGDQENKEFLRSVAQAIPRIDILIDDGGHIMEQQINTFDELFSRISPTGVYICEDLHTSYWRGYGGGYKRHGTFIEYSKNFIDQINAWHSKQPGRFDVSEFTRSVFAICYYDSMLVIEKRPIEKSQSRMMGTRRISRFARGVPVETFGYRLKRSIRKLSEPAEIFGYRLKQSIKTTYWRSYRYLKR